MRVLRTLVAALDSMVIEAAIQSAEYSIQGSTSDGHAALRFIAKEHPHLVILQNELFGLDGLSILKKLRGHMISGFPYVVMIFPGYNPIWETQARALGADVCLTAPYTNEQLRAAIRQACSYPCPSLSTAGKKIREEIISNLLDELKLPHKLKGRRYIARGVDLYVSTGAMRSDFDNTLYPAIGALFGATRQAVEKSIRTAIETTFLSGDLNAISRLFGQSFDSERGKPTNSECISMLAEHTTRKLASDIVKARQVDVPVRPK